MTSTFSPLTGIDWRVASTVSPNVWISVLIQELGDTVDATLESTPVSGENVKVTKTLTYRGSVIHSSTICELEVN